MNINWKKIESAAFEIVLGLVAAAAILGLLWVLLP